MVSLQMLPGGVDQSILLERRIASSRVSLGPRPSALFDEAIFS